MEREGLFELLRVNFSKPLSDLDKLVVDIHLLLHFFVLFCHSDQGLEFTHDLRCIRLTCTLIFHAPAKIEHTLFGATALASLQVEALELGRLRHDLRDSLELLREELAIMFLFRYSRFTIPA